MKLLRVGQTLGSKFPSFAILLCVVMTALTAEAIGLGGVPAPTSRAEFCGAIRNPEYFGTLAEAPENHLHFQNRGGLFNGGVCWWHSRLQRSALYLGVFRPDLQKPTQSQVEVIVHRLAANAGVVEIPGYRDLDEFSNRWWNIIQRKLNEWQLVDGFLRQAWIFGLSGHTHLKPEVLKAKMDSLYQEVEGKKRITWVMLQIPGIASHAWDIVKMKKFDGGYELEVIDSNFPRTMSTSYYLEGSNTLSTIYGPTIPYVGRQKDFQKFAAAAYNYCAPKPSDLTLEAVLPDHLSVDDGVLENDLGRELAEDPDGMEMPSWTF